jgi:hypothetical protein
MFSNTLQIQHLMLDLQGVVTIYESILSAGGPADCVELVSKLAAEVEERA